MKSTIDAIEAWVDDVYRQMPGTSFRVPCSSRAVAEDLVAQLHDRSIYGTSIEEPDDDCYFCGFPHKVVDDGVDRQLVRVFWFVVVTRR